MADEAVAVEAGPPPQGPLVAVTFQRNIYRSQKYLEAEPKALGITQIGLSVFQMTCLGVFLYKGLVEEGPDVAFFISSLLVVVAGCVAVAAQSLHLPTLRACLGMQIVACVASVFNVIFIQYKFGSSLPYCYTYNFDHENETSTQQYELCSLVERTHIHFFAKDILIQVTLFAISATLATYCCKVVKCCAPAKVPVITVQTPPTVAPQAAPQD
ncbi:uncharacterized protein ACBR49_018984 [Aulostomus maculatus]